MANPSDSSPLVSSPDKGNRMPFSKHTTESLSTIISPLALPRGVSGCFDQVAANGSAQTQLACGIHASSSAPAPHHRRGGQVYSPLSPGIRGPAVRAASLLSPRLHPMAKQETSHLEPRRSSYRSPETRNGMSSSRQVQNATTATTRDPAVGDSAVNGSNPVANESGQSMPLLSPTWAGQLQRPPDDSLAAPLLDTVSHTQTIQRLLKQNARIRDAWEAERKHLEANRERAEEVYKEERAIMEEERTEWEAERALLLAEIERLHQLVAALGGGTAPAKTPFCEGCGMRGGTEALSRESTDGSGSAQGSARSPTQPGESATADVGRVSSEAAPGTLKPAFLVSPNGPSHPASDFLKPTDTEAGPVPVVDVQDIHPELEGIRIKASSVRKATFTDSASSNGSKTAGLAGSPPSASTVQRGRKEQTLQVLAAAEADRLTMHAGHTPSHSLSDLASVPSSGTGTQTSSNGTATPTMPHEVGTTDPAPAKASKEQPASQAANDPHPLLRPSDAHGQPTDDHPEPMFEPTHDPQLTGPLMVRNMPAHDEIFFQALTDKLEEVSKDDKAALPAVLKDLDSAQDAGEPGEQTKPPATEAPADDSRSESSSRSPGSSIGDDELDIPLKFKKSTNFGAPFGELRASGIRGTRPSVVQDSQAPGRLPGRS